MTANSSSNMIDPSLSGAIKDWSEYSAETVKNALIGLEAITPVKDAMQVTQEVMETIQVSDWKPWGENLPDLATLGAAAREMAEIQQAAIQRLLDSYNNYLAINRDSGEQFVEKLKGSKSPQQWLAAWLESSLSLARNYQDESNQQASNLATIQAACKAWFQNTLQNLSTVSR